MIKEKHTNCSESQMKELIFLACVYAQRKFRKEEAFE